MTDKELIERLRIDSSKQDIVSCELTLQAAELLEALSAENARLREALRGIAKQKTWEECSEEERESGCFSDGFDICVEIARAAMKGGE